MAAANLTTPVWRLWLERRPVELSADEARLYELTFFPLARRRFAELARLGRWSDLEAGDVLVRPGQPVEEVVVPLTESVEARVGDRSLGRFAPGEVVGAGAVYGRPPRFEAVAGEGCRVLRVPVAVVRRHAERDDQLARTLERLIGQAAILFPAPASGRPGTTDRDRPRLFGERRLPEEGQESSRRGCRTTPRAGCGSRRCRKSRSAPGRPRAGSPRRLRGNASARDWWVK